MPAGRLGPAKRLGVPRYIPTLPCTRPLWQISARGETGRASVPSFVIVKLSSGARSWLTRATPFVSWGPEATAARYANESCAWQIVAKFLQRDAEGAMVVPLERAPDVVPPPANPARPTRTGHSIRRHGASPGWRADMEFFLDRADTCQARCDELRDVAADATALNTRADMLLRAWRWERLATLYRRIGMIE